jgi:hypothetical protein
MCLHLAGGGAGEPDQTVLVGIARHDLHEVEPEAGLQRFGKLGARRDRVVQAELDQALGDRRGDQPLRGLARHVELAGDLILGVARHVVEPGRARGEVQSSVLALVEFRRLVRSVVVGPGAIRGHDQWSGPRRRSSARRCSCIARNAR